RLRGMSAPGVITEKINRVWRVLGGWTTDPRYLDKSGLPKPLPFASNRGADFRQLAKECNTDVPARTLLDELLRADCVEELDDGKYTVKKKGYIPHALPAELIDTTANAAEFLLSTIVHNVHNPGAGAYLQREWHFQYVPVEAIPEVRALIEPETIRHGREMDKIMSEFAHKRPLKNKEYKQVGLGAYYFQI
ncbi:MAG: DUF6502 family protein, partial [Gammaproteobacteria bacterium]|nr:DUF6502 family protein [Gammaproteobacteria bacterium]